ncbi:protein RGF1 INDUCIBLE TRANSCRIPTION FACTOR 1-like isoform X3 [Malus domestica]|uniref:protein RGF1 INDUCIBLE TRANSCRIPTION FACTOR 1-like isoform X3 n=1 Tax=Malus domestica TaxID=3750 RepID=UPI0039766FFA
MDRTMLVPPWLEQLLTTSFFRVCRTHGDAARSESNMFCLDCSGDAFCFYCRSSRHKDHQVIQIRRSSYHDVVRVSEVQKVLDITGVQTYVINSARVMFLNERPQPKAGSKGASHICETCGRSLLDPVRFCSLGCKVLRAVERKTHTHKSLKIRKTYLCRNLARRKERIALELCPAIQDL